MRRAAIVSPLRTPIGAFGGALRTVPVGELGATVARAIVQRTGLDPALIEDVVFATEDKLAELGLQPMAFLKGWAVAGCDPSRMGIGPVPAVAKLFKRMNLGWDQMDLIELNEAFACQALAVLQGWGTPLAELEERLNVNGSGISLGHPVGATGVRIMTTLLYEMQRRKARYGLETMCIGGGQGIAAIFERA